MEARFIGDPAHDGDGPRLFPIYEMTFPKDQWVPVNDLSSDQVGKLAGNTHFEVRDSAAPAKAEAFDRDHDGTVGGFNKSPEKAALIAKLEATPGATFNRTWGVPRLQAALDAATAAAPEPVPTRAEIDAKAEADAEAAAWLDENED